jgi:hypothetical protein
MQRPDMSKAIPETTQLADLDPEAAAKPSHTVKEDTQARVILGVRLERPLFYAGLIAPAVLLVGLWVFGVF